MCNCHNSLETANYLLFGAISFYWDKSILTLEVLTTFRKLVCISSIRCHFCNNFQYTKVVNATKSEVSHIKKALPQHPTNSSVFKTKLLKEIMANSLLLTCTIFFLANFCLEKSKSRHVIIRKQQ